MCKDTDGVKIRNRYNQVPRLTNSQLGTTNESQEVSPFLVLSQPKLSKSIIGHVNSSSIEELWNTYKDGIQQAMDKNIPSKVCSKRKSLPWFNRNLKMVRHKARLYRRSKKTDQWTSFKNYQKHSKNAFKNAEINHINDVIQKGLGLCFYQNL